MAESFGLLQPASSESSGCIGDYFTYSGLIGMGMSHTFTLSAGNQERNTFLVTVMVIVPSSNRYLIGTTIIPAASEFYGIGNYNYMMVCIGTVTKSGNAIQYTAALQIQSLTVVVIGL